MEKQRWLKEGTIFFPIEGEIIVKDCPKSGIWKVVEHPNPMDGRLGIEAVSDKFDFPFKLYETGGSDINERVTAAWNSEVYKKSGKNLGVIYNGPKGVGKTIAAKLLCNEVNIPTLIVDGSFKGRILDFIRSLQFECVILIDEAEKTFSDEEDQQILLKLIDGVFNYSRKLYLLTTNRLSVNENLLGRPGRIRYIKEFPNLPVETVVEYVKDNLLDKTKVDELIKQVNQLSLSSIDALRAIVEEFNIFGNTDLNMNIEKSTNFFDCIKIYTNCGVDVRDKEIRSTILNTMKKEFKNKPLYECIFGRSREEENAFEKIVNGCGFLSYLETDTITSKYPGLFPGSECSRGTIREEPDSDGFFVIKSRYGSGEEELYLMLKKRSSANFYGSGLLV